MPQPASPVVATTPTPWPPAVLVAVVAWLAVAVAVALTGAIARAPAVGPLVIGLPLVAAALALRRPTVRAALAARELRALLALHVLRAPIGVAFLVEHAADRLPATFAVRAGWGDLAVGLGALGLIASGAGSGPTGRRATWLWNLLGALDLLVVVATAQYLLLVAHDPTMHAALARQPYPLLPTVVVPAMLALHLAVAHRLRGPR